MDELVTHGLFERVDPDAFANIGFGAGIITKAFDYAKPSQLADSDIIATTTGGFKINIDYDDEDLGADIDNCPEGTFELMERRNTRVSISFTNLNISAESLAMGIGAADINGSNVVLRDELKTTDFTKRFVVIDLLGGGYGVVELDNSIATGGLGITTTKNGKAQATITITAKRSFRTPKTVPVKFYVSKTAPSA